MSESRAYYIANCIDRIMMAAGNERRHAIAAIAGVMADDEITSAERHDRLIELVSDWESSRKFRRPPAHPDQDGSPHAAPERN